MRPTRAAGYLVTLAALVTMPFVTSAETGSTHDVAQSDSSSQVAVLAAGAATSQADAPSGEWPY